MQPTKTCSKCHKTKPLDEFYNHKKTRDGKTTECKECSKKYQRKYNQEHKERINTRNQKYKKEHKREASKQNKEWYERTGRQQKGKISMYEDKLCPAYLGIVIAERLVRHLFNDVEVMPYGNPGFDFICNKGKKIDVKSSCTQISPEKYVRWKFVVDHNITTDFFILVAFDNRTDINPLYLWMIPGKEVNDQGSISISPSTIHKWDKWKRDINDAQICCTEMKLNKN